MTDWCNDHYTISPEKDATYTESPTANYRMNTKPFISGCLSPRWMPTHISRKNDGKEKGKELVVFAKFADNLVAHSTVILAVHSKASKSVFKNKLSDMFEHFFILSFVSYIYIITRFSNFFKFLLFIFGGRGGIRNPVRHINSVLPDH